MKSPILFLDIDGVMNTTDSALLHQGGNVFTRDAVESLQWIVWQTDCTIVITSTRRREGLAAMRVLFSGNGLVHETARIIGGTPCFVEHDTDEWREDEIETWLDDNGAKLKFAILDDKPFFGPLRRHLILTDADQGLVPAMVPEVVALLHNGSPFCMKITASTLDDTIPA